MLDFFIEIFLIQINNCAIQEKYLLKARDVICSIRNTVDH